MFVVGLFLFSIVLGVASALIANKNKKDKQNSNEALNQDSIPRAVIGEKIGIVFGTVLIEGANTITSGNNHYIERIIKSEGGKK